MRAILDTSVLVRYLTGDDKTKANAAHALLETASDSSLLMPDVAVAELGFVLLRVYCLPAPSVADAIRAVVNHRAIHVPGRELWLDVASDLGQGWGIVDAYLLRTAERAGLHEVMTFDTSMKPLPGVRPITP